MKLLLLSLFLFAVGSFLGWVLEVFYRRFFSAKKWVNPGFMKGPWVPLYGFGVLVMFAMCYFIVSFFPESIHFYNPLGNLFGREYVSGASVFDLIPLVIMWLGMVGLEFIAGLIFIKGFHVKLWDYSNLKGNVMGIICPLFNLIWFAVAIIFYYCINPFLYLGATKMYEFMFSDNGAGTNFIFIFAMGIIYGIIIWDFSTSIGLFAKISKFSKESGIIERYESAKHKWEERSKELKNKLFSEKKEFEIEKVDALKNKIAEKIYIDPEKEKNKEDNYDENGRPIKIEDK